MTAVVDGYNSEVIFEPSTEVCLEAKERIQEELLKMIQIVVENAHKFGKWAGICGELGADPELTETFIRIGIDELSDSPSMILKIRKIVREMDIQ